MFDKNRECSIQEAAWGVLGLDMVAGSRKLKVIVAREPKFRDGLLKPIVKKDEGENFEIFVPGIFEHYAMRPLVLEDLCLADFAAFFEFSTRSGKKQDNCDFLVDDNEDEMDNAGNDKDYDDHLLNKIPTGTVFKLLDNSGYVKKRKFRCILNYRRDKKDATENARSTLLLFKSWRDENRDIHNSDFKILLENNEEEISQNIKKYEKNTSLFDQLDEIEQKIKDTEANSISEEEADEEEEYQKEIETEVNAFEKEFLGKAANSTPKDEESEKLNYDAMKEQVRTLNSQQRAILDEFIERSALPVGILPPVLLHILGSAGTGKSYLLRTLIAVTKYVLERKYVSINLEQPTVQVGAPTNNSAFQILGQTIHSLLGFGFGGEDDSNNTYTNVNGEIAKDLPWKFFNTRLMFLDEVSMIGSNMFSKISLRLQEIVNLFPGWKSKSFGGMDMVVLGDFFQLPPVLDRFCFKNSTLRGRCAGLSINHYTQNVKSYFLTEKIRSAEDDVFGELCDKIAKNSLEKRDLRLLEERNNVACPGEDKNESYKNGDIMILCLENKRIDEINSEKIKINKNPVHEFTAQDKYANLSEPVSSINLSYTETQNLPTNLSLKIDTPVIITKNINKKDKLVNGKRGFIHEIDPQKKIVWINFYEDDVGKIARFQSQNKPKKASNRAVPIYLWKSPVTFPQFGKRKGGPLVTRCNQFPIVPAYAATVHKSQGLTLKYVIIDFKQNSKKAVPSGAFYTAVTRVRSLQNIFLRNFDKSHIRTDSDVLQEIDRLKTVPYKFIKPYLNDSVFKNCPKELKVSYLNSNGLLSKLEDVRADFNLMRSDILCLSETKLNSSVSNKNLKLDTFEICSRLDGEKQSSGGMIVYAKHRVCPYVNVIEKRCKKYKESESYMEQIKLNYEDVKLSFVYIHPNLAKKASESLKKITEDLADSAGTHFIILMGYKSIVY